MISIISVLFRLYSLPMRLAKSAQAILDFARFPARNCLFETEVLSRDGERGLNQALLKQRLRIPINRTGFNLILFFWRQNV